jgi:uncharacterized damage-inducible protein DinB
VPVEGFDPEVGLLLAMLDNATKEWREDLGEISDEAIGWQPAPEMHSIGALILHIAAVEVWWLYEVLAGKEISDEERVRLQDDELDQYNVKWPDPPKQPLSWFLAEHDRVRERTKQTLLEINDPNASAARKDRVFTFRWLMSHMINHEAYHGGQVMLLKLAYERIHSDEQARN